MFQQPTPLEAALKLVNSSDPAPPSQLKGALAALDIRGAEAEVEHLERSRQNLLMRGASEAALDAAEAKIRAANRTCERVVAAHRKLKSMIANAQSPEAKAELEATATEAKLAQKRGLEALAEFDGLASRIAHLLDVIKDVDQTIQQANTKVKHGERSDLVTWTPLAMLQKHLGCEASDFPNLWRWNDLHGYRPYRSRQGFSRALELVEPAIRKSDTSTSRQEKSNGRSE